MIPVLSNTVPGHAREKNAQRRYVGLVLQAEPESHTARHIFCNINVLDGRPCSFEGMNLSGATVKKKNFEFLMRLIDQKTNKGRRTTQRCPNLERAEKNSSDIQRRKNRGGRTLATHQRWHAISKNRSCSSTTPCSSKIS